MLKEPITIVSGAARGIGAAVCSLIVERGGIVIAADLDRDALAQLQHDLGTNIVPVVADATSEVDTKALFALALERFDHVDAAFANAGGVGVRGPFEDTTLDDFNSTVDQLLNSVFLMFKHGIRTMRPQGHGALVATASVASIHGGLGPHAYTAAKHGVKGLVESAAKEIAKYGMTANAVAPGGTVSSLSAGLLGDRDDVASAYTRLAATSASGVPTTAHDVASAAVFLALDAPRINGATLVIDGGDYVLPSHSGSHHSPPQIATPRED